MRLDRMKWDGKVLMEQSGNYTDDNCSMMEYQGVELISPRRPMDLIKTEKSNFNSVVLCEVKTKSLLSFFMTAERLYFNIFHVHNL